MPKKMQAIGPSLDRTELNREIAQAISENKTTWDDLLKSAGLAPQTRDKITDEKGEFTGLRSDVILRICRMLGTSVETCQRWLAWAGHDQFSVTKIETFLAHARKGDSDGDAVESQSSSASDYFAHLTESLKSGSQILMCSCIVSKPAPIDDEKLRRNVITALQSGLHTALFCPYPCGDTMFNRFANKPRLFEFYSQVFNWARSLRGTLREALPASQKPQVQVFVLPPETTGKQLHLVPPTLTSGANRPNLVKKIKKDEVSYELGSYGRRQRHWQTIYPSTSLNEEDQHEAVQFCDYWKDYFPEILEGWRPDNAKEPFPKETSNWKSLDAL
jgi:hypothetical protein